jgi:E3 SUMO-protein ligase PIAS1
LPESIDDVIVEADGEWHTPDNKYGTTAWKAKHPVTELAPAPKKEETPPPLTVKVEVEIGLGKPNGQQKTDVSYILLSDDDEEEVQKELSPSQSADRSINSTPQRQGQKKATNVIDLTLDSDSDEPAPAQPGKRKITETELGPASPTEPIWKKGRHEMDYQLPSITTLHNSASSPHYRQSAITSGGRLPPPYPINPGSPTRYPHYPGTSAPLHNSLPIRGNGSAPGALQLPPLPGLSQPRQGGQARWS